MKTPTKIAKEAGITLFGETYGGFSRFLFIGLLSRWVGPELLGLYAIANAVTRMASVVATVGMDRGVLRYVSFHRGLDEKSKALSSIYTVLKIGLFSAIALMVIQIMLAPYLTVKIFKEDSILTLLIIFFAVSMPFAVLSNIMGYATQGYKLLKYKVTALQIVQPTIMLIGLLITYLYMDQTAAVILPILMAEIAGFFAIGWFLRRLSHIRLRNIFTTRINPEILKFSYPLMFMTIVGTLMHWIDILMLGIFLDSEQVGLYQPAVRTMGVIRMFLLAFNGIFAPMISELYAKNNIPEMKRLYRLVFRWILIFALPILVLLFLYPAKIMLLFGPEFLPGSDVIRVLAIGIILQSLTGIGSSLLVMIGRTRLNLLNILAASILNIVLNIILIPRMGLIGAAWGTVGAMTLLSIIRTVECQVITKINPFQLKLLKPVAAFLVVAALLLYLRPVLYPLHTVLTLVFASLISGTVYLLVIYLLKLDDDDREVIQAVKKLIKKEPA